MRTQRGNLCAVVRVLGIPYAKVVMAVDRGGLRPEVTRLRREVVEERSRKIERLLRQHVGNLSATARALGIRPSSLPVQLVRHGLNGLARALRPKPLHPEAERRQLIALIDECQGQMGQIAQRLGVSRNTLTTRIKRHHLLVRAEGRRAEANLYGSRKHLPPGYKRRERRAKLLATLEYCQWNVTRAIQLIGIAPATLYKNMRELGIVRPTRKEMHLHELIDALRWANGVRQQAARRLGVGAETVTLWCREFEVDPSDYRRK